MDKGLSAEQAEALHIAGELIDAGAPVFVAKPCPTHWGTGVCPIGKPHGAGGYHLPNQWQKTVASRVWLDRWNPGDALALVGGVAVDAIDEDPRNGGDISVTEMQSAGQWPRVFGVAETPSGGRHYLISVTGEAECNGFMPGLDLQSGQPDGAGRAFVFIAPTVKASKTDGTLGAYRWVKVPELDMLGEFSAGGDDSIEGVRTRVAAHRARSARKDTREGTDPDDPFLVPSRVTSAGAASAGQDRAFTTEEARAYCRDALMALAAARVGGIEEACNRAAATLSHFVPAFWSADEAMDLLKRQLSFTAYDESHPASAWTVEKFRAVLDGRRPTLDPWLAQVRESVADEVASVTGDDVDALLAEMLSLRDVATRPPSRYLIKGLLNLDSEAWVIGPPGSRKSFVVLDMALSVAQGKPWQGCKVNAADVLIIAAEGAGGLSKRVRAYEAVNGPLPPNVHVLPRPVQASDAKAWAVLVAAAERLLGGRDAFIVLDTQARLTVGLEENSAKDMGYYIAAIGALKTTTGGCVLSVHHTGRKGGDARGSSAIDGAQDTELKIVKEDGLRGRLFVEKQKDLDEREPMPLLFERVVIGQDEDGDDLTSLVLNADSWKIAEDEAARSARDGGQQEWCAPAESTVDLIARVLSDHAGNRGLTQSETRGVVVERFFGNVGARLKKTTWSSAWTRAIDRELITNVGGERFSADQVVIEEYRARSASEEG